MSLERLSGWGQTTLGDVAEINPTSLPSSTSGDFEFRYIDVATVAGPSILLEPRRLRFAEAPSRARRVVADGDILVSTVRPYLRSFCRVRDSKADLVASTGFAVVRAREGVDGGFLYQHVLAEWFIKHLVPRMKGSNYPAVSPQDVADYPLHLPPLAEQRRIAEILSSVDEAIQATQAVIEQTRKVKEGVLQRLLTKGIGHTRFKQTEIGEIPEPWQVKSLGQIAEFVNGRGFKPYEWSERGLPIIRIQNLNGGMDFNHFDGSYDKKLIVNPGDLLFAWSGSRGTSFGPHLWKGPRGLLNYHTWRVAPLDISDIGFIYYALSLLTKRIEADSHGASALVHMQKKNIVNYKIAIPPVDERNKIIDILEKSDNSLEATRQEHARLEMVKSALASELLIGRRRVSASLPLAAE